MNKIFLPIDYLDVFLNKAHWSYYKYENYLDLKKNYSLSFTILNNLNIDYFMLLNYSGHFVDNKQKPEKVYVQEFINNKKLILNLKESNFSILEDVNSRIYISKFNILVEITSKRPRMFTVKKDLLYVGENSKSFYFKKNKLIIFQRKLIARLYSKVLKIKKKFYILKLIGFKNYKNFDPNRVYELSFKNFLNLKIEKNDSINWLLRKNHLDLLTNNRANLYFKEIISYFKKDDNLNKSIKKVKEVDTSKIFKEPIHINRKFWETGNNFFIYPLYFQFKRGVVSYKLSNVYISSNEQPSLFSYEYYENLTSMPDKELSEFLAQNPIEITENYITSGRHRASAMCGRVIAGKNYLPMYFKINFYDN